MVHDSLGLAYRRGFNPGPFVEHSQGCLCHAEKGTLIRVFCAFEITLAACVPPSTRDEMHSLTALIVLEVD